jgi:CubicO group peptidase (beta-lactamase class C family)
MVREGQVVVDRVVGCRPDALFWIFSASKPFVALLVHLLAQRGELSLDDRVAEHWPRFGQHGKESVTIRQVLQLTDLLTTGHEGARNLGAVADAIIAAWT